MRKVLSAVISIGLLATPVMAKPPLNEVTEINNAVLDLAIADRIRKRCPSISARMMAALGFMNKIKQSARDLGYTNAEIDAYTNGKSEKERLKDRRSAFFRAKGVDTSDPQSYCTLGHAEIQKSSRIGSLLRAK